MILNEQSALRLGEPIHDTSLKESGDSSLSSEEIIDSSTPRKVRSASYSELTSPLDENHILSDTSLQRMRCLSQSISELKVLREKQKERQHETGDLLKDDFLQEHARKLKEARNKIKELEAKYQSAQHMRKKFEETSDEKRRRKWTKSLEHVDPSSHHTGEEQTDGSRGTSVVQNGITQADANRTARKSRKPRPLTWATEDDFTYGSDCSLSLSSFGSNRQRAMEIIPENLDSNRNHLSFGYAAEPGNGGTMSHHLTTRKHSLSNPTTCTNTAKWRSMPNLPIHGNGFLEDRALMYGDAIPVDPTEVTKKHNTRFTRKSGFYEVNESLETGPIHSTKKRKFREKLFGRKKASKKSSQKRVSSPTEGEVMGRILRCHPGIDSAYVIELNRPADQGMFGFGVRKGYKEYATGIFVNKFVDKKAEKFLSGLLFVGDEILEINSKNVQEESLPSVQKLIQDADTLQLSILPCSSRNER